MASGTSLPHSLHKARHYFVPWGAAAAVLAGRCSVGLGTLKRKWALQIQPLANLNFFLKLHSLTVTQVGGKSGQKSYPVRYTQSQKREAALLLFPVSNVVVCKHSKQESRPHCSRHHKKIPHKGNPCPRKLTQYKNSLLELHLHRSSSQESSHRGCWRLAWESFLLHILLRPFRGQKPDSLGSVLQWELLLHSQCQFTVMLLPMVWHAKIPSILGTTVCVACADLSITKVKFPNQDRFLLSVFSLPWENSPLYHAASPQLDLLSSKIP